MADTSGQLNSFPEGQPATFLVTTKFGDNLLLSQGAREFVAVLLDRPVPQPGLGIDMSSAKAGVSAPFDVVRSFASGYLVLAQSNGITYFATLVDGGN